VRVCTYACACGVCVRMFVDYKLGSMLNGDVVAYYDVYQHLCEEWE
jgi:hypothetical protein